MGSSFRYTNPYLKVIPIKSTLYEPIYFNEKNTTSTIIDNKGLLEFSKKIRIQKGPKIRTHQYTKVYQWPDTKQQPKTCLCFVFDSSEAGPAQKDI